MARSTLTVPPRTGLNLQAGPGAGRACDCVEVAADGTGTHVRLLTRLPDPGLAHPGLAHPGLAHPGGPGPVP